MRNGERQGFRFYVKRRILTRTMKDIAEFVPAPPPKWVERFARLGLIAKGVVYSLIGMLAFMAAFELGGTSEENTDQKGVFRFILEQPMGKVLLGIIGVGLVFY